MKKIILIFSLFIILGFNNITTININFIGDCTFGNYFKQDYKYSFDNMYDIKKDTSYFFRRVRNIFRDDDLTIANLEGPLTDDGEMKEKGEDISYNFKGRKEYAKILKDGYVELVNLSNNHVYDYGKNGYLDTLESLKRNNIDWYGNGKFYLKTIKGVKIGILGYKLFGVDKLNMKSYKAYLSKQIENTRKKCDFLIVSYHWGEENKYYPSKVQIEIAHFLIDNGVDLIVGHHPHVVQGIENYKGKQIVYSLGNFCYGGNRKPKDFDTFIFNVKIKFNSQKQIIGVEPNIIPCSISSSKNINDYSPKILIGKEAERVLNKIKNLSNLLNKY